MEKHVIKIPIGDWSDDGHGKCDIYKIESNYPVGDLQNAYKASCKLTGVQFNHNQDYTGLKPSYRSERLICTEYEDGSVSSFAQEVFEEFGCTDKFLLEEGYFDGTKHFTKVLLWFIGLSMPKDWVWNLIAEDDNIPYLNGFWNDNLNVQFGYGLFY
jgi:hypothetical protein